MRNPRQPKNHLEPISRDEVARNAYLLWEQAGCPDGDAERFWFAAEQQLSGRSPVAASATPATSEVR